MPENVVICFLKTEKLVLEELRALVSETDLADAAQFRLPEVALRTLARRSLTRWCLAHYVRSVKGQGDFSEAAVVGSPGSLRIVRDDFGKPELPGGPHFSCSSTPGLVACALAHDEPVGLDVESLIRGSLLGLDKEALWIWTRKEAVSKSVGLGLDLAMDGLKVLDSRRLEITATGQIWTTERLEWKDQFVGAISMPTTSDCSIRAYEFRLDPSPSCNPWTGFQGQTINCKKE